MNLRLSKYHINNAYIPEKVLGTTIFGNFGARQIAEWILEYINNIPKKYHKGLDRTLWDRYLLEYNYIKSQEIYIYEKLIINTESTYIFSLANYPLEHYMIVKASKIENIKYNNRK